MILNTEVSLQVSRLSSMSACYRNPRRHRSRVDSENADDRMDEVDQSGTMTDTLAFDTIRSRAGRRQEPPNEVPPLGISLDADQMKYMRQMSAQQESETVAETDVNKMQAGHLTAGTERANNMSSRISKHQLYVYHYHILMILLFSICTFIRVICHSVECLENACIRNL